MAWIQRMWIKRLQTHILKHHRSLFQQGCNGKIVIPGSNASCQNVSAIRYLNSSASSSETCTVHRLDSRGIVQVSGRDAVSFLQGLVTNDVTVLENQTRSLYAMLLNTQGRVLYDLLLYKMPNAADNRILMECQKDIIPDLMKMIKMYKIRKKVDISNVSDVYKTYAAFNLNGKHSTVESDTVHVFSDPRVNEFSSRIITSSDLSDSSIRKTSIEESEKSYHAKRYQFGIGEGTLDFPFGNCTPLESNLVLLNGVSFTKGCYLGQELTARTHHTGVIRKRLMPLEFESPPELETGARVLNEEGQAIGKFRNSEDLHGLALLRVVQVKKTVSVEGKDGKMYEAKVHRPAWWPSDLMT